MLTECRISVTAIVSDIYEKYPWGKKKLLEWDSNFHSKIFGVILIFIPRFWWLGKMAFATMKKLE